MHPIRWMFFDVVVASAEAGVKKPNPQLFQIALAQANCRAREAAMVGDRLDNDIFPAKSLGFTTVRVLQGFGKLQHPASPAYEPDYTIASLPRLLGIF